MDTFAKAVISVLQFFLEFFSLEGGRDHYVRVEPGNSEETPVKPFARTDVPRLGDDHEKLVAQAERLYTSDELRYKWLMAVHKVRQTKSGWILDPASKDRPSPSWGLTYRTV